MEIHDQLRLEGLVRRNISRIAGSPDPDTLTKYCPDGFIPFYFFGHDTYFIRITMNRTAVKGQITALLKRNKDLRNALQNWMAREGIADLVEWTGGGKNETITKFLILGDFLGLWKLRESLVMYLLRT